MFCFPPPPPPPLPSRFLSLFLPPPSSLPSLFLFLLLFLPPPSLPLFSSFSIFFSSLSSSSSTCFFSYSFFSSSSFYPSICSSPSFFHHFSSSSPPPPSPTQSPPPPHYLSQKTPSRMNRATKKVFKIFFNVERSIMNMARSPASCHVATSLILAWSTRSALDTFQLSLPHLIDQDLP